MPIDPQACWLPKVPSWVRGIGCEEGEPWDQIQESLSLGRRTTLWDVSWSGNSDFIKNTTVLAILDRNLYTYLNAIYKYTGGLSQQAPNLFEV